MRPAPALQAAEMNASARGTAAPLPMASRPIRAGKVRRTPGGRRPGVVQLTWCRVTTVRRSSASTSPTSRQRRPSTSASHCRLPGRRPRVSSPWNSAQRRPGCEPRQHHFQAWLVGVATNAQRRPGCEPRQHPAPEARPYLPPHRSTKAGV